MEVIDFGKVFSVGETIEFTKPDRRFKSGKRITYGGKITTVSRTTIRLPKLSKKR